jgi:hypothetical protein
LSFSPFASICLICGFRKLASFVTVLTIEDKLGCWETVEKPTHVTRELFGADIGGGTKEHPLKGL